MMRFLSPRWLISLSLIFWAVCMLAAPLSYDVATSTRALVILVSYFLFFYMGAGMFGLYARFHGEAGISGDFAYEDGGFLDARNMNRLLLVFFVIALVGLGMRFYDLLVTKSLLSFSSVSDFKLNYDESQTNYGVNAVLSSILAPFGAALLVLSAYYPRRLPLSLRTAVYAVTGLLAGYFVLRGGRTALTLILVMFIAAKIMSQKAANFRITKSQLKKVVLGFVLATGFFSYSLYLLSGRLESMGFTLESGLEYIQHAHHFTIRESLLDFASNGEFSAAMVYTYVSLSHYVIHGYYQFMLLVSSFDLSDMTFGAEQFYPIFKFFGLLGYEAISAAELTDLLEEPGVYSTFFGPVFMDFGYWGFLYCFLLGALSQWSWTGARKGSGFHLMLYPYIAAVIAHSSFLNMIQGGMGLYFFVAMVLAGLVVSVSRTHTTPHNEPAGVD